MAITVISILLMLAGVAVFFGLGVRWRTDSERSYNYDPRGRGRSNEPEPEEQKDTSMFNTKKVFIGAALFFVGLLLILSTSSVPPGHRGVRIAWGGAVGDVVGEGLVIRVPLVESVRTVDVRVQAHEFKNIDAASKEMQSVKMTGNVNWHFDPVYVNWIVQNIGASTDFVDKILDKALQDFLKEVTPTYSISEILTKRPDIRQRAVNFLSDNLGRYHIIINDIYIADMQFSPEYTAAIERQQTAERQILTEKNILEQKRIVADQAKVEAEGKANATIAAAEGEKQSTILRSQGQKEQSIITSAGQATAITTVADAQAKANETVNKTLSDKIIQYTLAQKLGDDIKVIILPSGQQFILGPEVLGK
jgi:regulator of protease activity HflC (stomatin/prohibitin superfamily)